MHDKPEREDDAGVSVRSQPCRAALPYPGQGRDRLGRGRPDGIWRSILPQWSTATMQFTRVIPENRSMARSQSDAKALRRQSGAADDGRQADRQIAFGGNSHAVRLRSKYGREWTERALPPDSSTHRDTMRLHRRELTMTSILFFIRLERHRGAALVPSGSPSAMLSYLPAAARSAWRRTRLR